jgi:two-component system nitrogen regulation response regulator NtrX
MNVERILVVDDEPGVRTALEGILEDEGFEVDCAETGEEGLEKLSAARYDAVLLDVWLPGADGLAILKTLRERNHDPAVVMISGHGTIETAVGATKLGAFDFVEKPLSLERTLLVLRNALRQRQLEKTNVQLLEHLSRDTEITGSSPASERLRHAVEIAAEASIHAASRTPDAPFVEVPVAALDDGAAAEALFGDGDRPGRLDLAAGGCLFVEDADRLSTPLQKRLAAAIGERARRVAGLRVIASTAVNPQLNAELAHQLQRLRIDVPSLKERSDDLHTLAERFMVDSAREYAREPKRLSADALKALAAWHWPGNVRELRNLMERLLLFVDADEIHAKDLPQPLVEGSPSVDLYGRFKTLDAGLQAFVHYHIERCLAESGGDWEASAARLGLTIEELRRRAGQLQSE